MPLHLYYRPKNFNDFIGNYQMIKSLLSVIDRPDKPRSYMFYGPTGTGKTTLARLLKDYFQCHDREFIEINTASERGIDTSREIQDRMRFRPMHGNCKIFFIDEVGATTKTFQEALLKPLEDTPDYVYFILCTTDPQKVLKTVKNRCSSFELKTLSDIEMGQLIDWVLTGEKVNDIPDHIVNMIIEKAEGCPRQALVILDQIIDLEIADMEEAINSINTEEAQIKDLCQALIKKGKWEIISKIIKGLSGEPETVRRAVLGYMNAVMLNGNTGVGYIINEFSGNFYDSGKAGLTMACYMCLKK